MILPVDPARYAAFLATMSVLAATPGPANLFSIANGMRRGRGAVLEGVVGMSSATLVWFAGAALGLGALVIAFPDAFHLLAIAGGLYVAWLGISAILAGWRNAPEAETPDTHLNRSAFRDGFAVQLANPKALVFFAGVLPPFIDPQRPVPLQLVMFAIATIGMDFITMTAYGLGGAALASRMSEPRFRRLFRYSVGALLILAAGLILSRH
ncbi:MAG: LysE family translocator [Caulobacter sp.]|nr:LysE family translocator [Caulobacter sp.]